MRILFIADKESEGYWDYFSRENFPQVDLIVSCGDLKAEYLSFLTTMTSVPVLYVHGNHDDSYEQKPPEGCICIEDDIYVHEGVRFLGLGGCMRYKQGIHQYTEKQMSKRIKKLWWKLLYHKGFDVLVTHAPAAGFHDDESQCHQGFACFLHLIKKYNPKYFVHSHVHMNYGRQFPREDVLGDTKVFNAYDHFIVELDN